MLFLNKRYYRCVLEVVLLLLLSLFSGTTALFPNGASCRLASECESGACLFNRCVDKIPFDEACSLQAPCLNPENTTCNFVSASGTIGFCEVAKKPGEVCTNLFPQSLCIDDPKLACIQRLGAEPKCLILLGNGQEKPNDNFFCDTFNVVDFIIGQKTICSDANPGDVCNVGSDCFGPDCFENKCICHKNRCVKRGLDGEDCPPGIFCAEGLKCLIVRQKCTAGELGSPCTLNIDCGTETGGLECSGGAGGFCVKRGGIGQPCTGGAAGLTQGTCASGLRCSGRRGTCGCRPVIGCP